MSKIYMLLITLLFTLSTQAQETTQEHRPFIEVRGSAEMIVQPDEIELEIVLSEYHKGKISKAAFEDIDINDIETQFNKVLQKNNIDKSRVLLSNTGSYWYYWWTYRNALNKRKRFLVKMNKDSDFLQLMKDLNFEGVQSVRIANSTNNKIQEYRKEVKILAMKAAKEKATYLVQSIDEELDGVISIKEITTNNFRWGGQQNLISNVAVNASSSTDAIDNVAEIKLRYEINAKFAIAQ